MASVREIYRRRGLNHLLDRVFDYLNWRLKSTKASVIDRLWDVRGGTQTATVNGTTITYDRTIAGGGPRIRHSIEDESSLLKDFLQELSPSDTVWDIGANVGLLTCFALRGASGKIVAFEPYPPNIGALSTNIAHNAGSDRAKVFNLALGASPGEVEFTVPEDAGTGLATGSITPGADEEDSDSETIVEVVTGDDLSEKGEAPGPDIVKIDIEGAEYGVLDGMRAVLTNSECRIVYVEVHLPAEHRTSILDHGHRVPDIFDILRDLGFTVSVIESRGPELQIKATKSDGESGSE